MLYMESADDGAKEDVASGKNSEPFCAKLATADGSVSFLLCFVHSLLLHSLRYIGVALREAFGVCR